jgi:hypothetical protein
MKCAGLLVLSAALSLGGCATPVGKGASDTVRMTRVGLREAVAAPLTDFNLIRSKVPPVLAEAAKDAYHLPAGGAECAALIKEVRRLDLALGPDLDVPSNAGRPTIANRASHAASDAALDAVRDVTTGWIPFRSTVRRLTGAANNQDEIEDAVHAGAIRRAYLKGLGLQQGCEHPAAPLPAPTRELIVAQKAAPTPAPPPVDAPATGQGDAAPADPAPGPAPAALIPTTVPPQPAPGPAAGSPPAAAPTTPSAVQPTAVGAAVTPAVVQPTPAPPAVRVTPLPPLAAPGPAG